MKKLNVAIIGYGMSSKVFHLPIIRSLEEEFIIRKIHIRNSNNIQDITKKYPDVHAVTNLDEILQDENIDLVIITTPNNTHFDIAYDALENGKHVLVEKPFTIDYLKGKTLLKKAKEVNRLISVHHNRIYDSDFKTVKNIINSNILGEVVEYESHYDRYKPLLNEKRWKETAEKGSDLLYDLGSHLIDQCLYLFGLPIEIFADLNTQRIGSKNTDNFELILKYKDRKVTLKSSSFIKEGIPKYIISGRNGSFFKTGIDSQESSLNKGLTPCNLKTWGEEEKEYWGKIKYNFSGIDVDGIVRSENGDYRQFFINLISDINNLDYSVAIRAINVIKIINLSYKSNNEKTWVKF